MLTESQMNSIGKPDMKTRKATHSQLRLQNRQLLLRAVYTGLANSRVDLAHTSGLAKPTVSDLISELIDEGYLIEIGLGQSTDEGGKRPRLLEFVPDARHVIGVSVSGKRILGVLANLDGRVLVRHEQKLNGAQGQIVIDLLSNVINGLIAQLSAPLLCIGIGVSGLIDPQKGIVRLAPLLGWKEIRLAEIISRKYHIPTYVANSTELAAMAQFAFGQTDANSLVTILVNDSVGVGAVLDNGQYHSGSELNQLQVVSTDGSKRVLETFLGWSSVRQRTEAIIAPYLDSLLIGDELTYLHLRQAILDEQPDALAFQEELAEYLAQICSWVIMLMRPEHISLAGTISNMGQPLLDCVIDKTRELVQPDLLETITFSVDTSLHLVPLGAVAHTLQKELGLI